jgi:Fe-S-cluster containining protein
MLVNVAYRILITDEDIERWRVEKREDILAWIGSRKAGDGPDGGHTYIHIFPIHPLVPRLIEGRCPFLGKSPQDDTYVCKIHDTKPLDCRVFPNVKWAAERIGCPGFE